MRDDPAGVSPRPRRAWDIHRYSQKSTRSFSGLSRRFSIRAIRSRYPNVLATIVIIGLVAAGIKLKQSYDEVVTQPLPGQVAELPPNNESATRNDSPDDAANIEQLLEGIPSASFQLPELTEEQIAEIRDWDKRHGYFNYYRDYGLLSESALNHFALSGDIGALHALAGRYALKDPDQAIHYYRAAANHGSTYALLLIGELYLFHAGATGNLDDPIDTAEARVQALAHSFAAQMLGDNEAAGKRSESLLAGPDSVLRKNAALLESACKKATDIVAEISETRFSSGQPSLSYEPAPYAREIDPSATYRVVCGIG